VLTERALGITDEVDVTAEPAAADDSEAVTDEAEEAKAGSKA
jgi:hypothetical protein